jgi:type VI secretion system protein ImpM
MRGFYGKIPVRGDFMGEGLPHAVVDSLDGWMRASLAASREALGEAWEPIWMEAPVWRFFAPIAGCALGGVWLPSIDRVGRTFPLVLATDAAAAGPAWMDGAEALGFAAVTEDLPPDALSARLAALGPDPCTPENGWWTAGGPRRRAGRVQVSGLPDPADFATFLSDSAAEAVR